MVAQANFADQVIVPSQHFADKLLTQGVTSPLTVLSNGLEDSVLEAIGPAQVRSYEPEDTARESHTFARRSTASSIRAENRRSSTSSG